MQRIELIESCYFGRRIITRPSDRTRGPINMAAEAPPAQGTAPTDAEAPAPIVLDQVVAPLRALPEGERAAGAAALVRFADLMKAVQVGLLTRDPENEEILDQDRILLAYLAAYFNGVAATPHIIHGDMMERSLVASGMVMPFAGPSHTGGAARFGVPTNVTPDVLCDSVSELARMAVAALLALFVYLNFKRGGNDLPSDQAVLVFTTIAINSTANAANAEAIDRQIEELGAEGGIRCAQIRWLMHFVRQMVMGQMGAVAHIMGDKNRHAECCVAAQHDHRLMVKALPEMAGGYSLWARSAMGFQQMGVAAAVLQKGLDAAAAARDDAREAALAYQMAVAKMLGGGGGGGGGGAAGGEEGGGGGEGGGAAAAVEVFSCDEVLELQRRGAAAAASVAAWWPAPWAEQLPTGDPDRTVLAEKLVPMAEEKSGVKFATGASMPVLQGVLYVTRAPSSVPPGALDQLGVGGGGGAEGVPEEEEEVEEAEAEHVVQV
ncbi:MAG: hypothetical protein J3K34DRAFT_74041 [Monoraphidium minutum]|nr:MAG: hypothetical protein J3K34DRAFT_74041 [Monoraphidium minutum]